MLTEEAMSTPAQKVRVCGLLERRRMGDFLDGSQNK